MCSICGFTTKGINDSENIISRMNSTMTNRGPDQQDIYIKENIALGHNRLAIIDVESGLQPMTRTYKNETYTIVYNGELYNTKELVQIIEKNDIVLQTKCDTEVVLYMYILFGEACAKLLNGIFAFAVFEQNNERLCLIRDRFGVKPLFYTIKDDNLIFASEIKAILEFPNIKAKMTKNGLYEMIFLAPIRLGGGIFKGIEELEPAHFAVFENGKFDTHEYWQIKAQECTESRSQILEQTRFLLTDAIERQLVSDVPLCTLLSGGLDSSIISSVAARYYKRNGEKLTTFSFEHENNKKHFKNNIFQPQSDDEYAIFMGEWLDTDHVVLTAPTEEVANLLVDATYARDFAGQADIDSSLLYYCQQIKKTHTVSLSGECADEIFGGYPWFYRPEMLEKQFYPWMHNPMARVKLFNDSFINAQQGFEYLQNKYKESVDKCPVLDTDTACMRQSRIATWLSVKYFMSSLLERKDRMSMKASVEVRVPFADHRILQYVYNVPWDIKYENCTEKALLRNSMAEYLPDKILNRKKSPYPKTRNPEYERLVLNMLNMRMSRKNSVINEVLSSTALDKLLLEQDATWLGQLMSRPQMIAWLIQFDLWCEKYNVEFVD